MRSASQEYLDRLTRAALDDSWHYKPEAKPKVKPRAWQMFTPMSYDDYHDNGQLKQERMDFNEHQEHVSKLIKQHNRRLRD